MERVNDSFCGQFIQTRTRYLQKVDVWARISGHHIIVQFFPDVLKSSVFTVWWLPSASNTVWEYWADAFSNNVIGTNHAIPWSVRSPDFYVPKFSTVGNSVKCNKSNSTKSFCLRRERYFKGEDTVHEMVYLQCSFPKFGLVNWNFEFQICSCVVKFLYIFR